MTRRHSLGQFTPPGITGLPTWKRRITRFCEMILWWYNYNNYCIKQGSVRWWWSFTLNGERCSHFHPTLTIMVVLVTLIHTCMYMQSWFLLLLIKLSQVSAIVMGFREAIKEEEEREKEQLNDWRWETHKNTKWFFCMVRSLLKKDTFSCCQYFYNWLWKKKTFWNLLLLVVKTFQCFANSYFSSERLESGSEQMFSSSFVSSSGEHNSYVSSSGEHKFFVSSSGAGTNYLSHRQVPAQFFCLLIMWHKSETQNNFIWNKCWQVFLSNND